MNFMYHHTTIETTLCPYPWLGRCLVRSTQTSAKKFLYGGSSYAQWSATSPRSIPVSSVGVAPRDQAGVYGCECVREFAR